MEPPELRSGGGGEPPADDDETVARKRARRVSFAETTAVHVFARDEDFETSSSDSKPTATANSSSDSSASTLQLTIDGVDDESHEVEDEGDDSDAEEQEKFVRDMDSSSPGSAVGSITSNDDDNFFGPVSTSFIKSGRFSDSGVSDDSNHDITLDSTAFSLHFKNIAPPDDSANSAGSLRTPFDESLTADPGSFTGASGFKKTAPRRLLSDDKLNSNTNNSNNMSFVKDNTGKYNYEKLSPTLETLLQEVSKSLKESPKSIMKIVASDHQLHGDVNANVCEKDKVKSPKSNHQNLVSDWQVNGVLDVNYSRKDVIKSPNRSSRDTASYCPIEVALDAPYSEKDYMKSPNSQSVPCTHEVNGTSYANDCRKDEMEIETATAYSEMSNDGFSPHHAGGSSIALTRDQVVADAFRYSEDEPTNELSHIVAKGIFSSTHKESFTGPFEARSPDIIAQNTTSSDAHRSPKLMVHSHQILSSDHKQLDSPHGQAPGRKFSDSSPESVQNVAHPAAVNCSQHLLLSGHGMHTPKSTTEPFQPSLQGSVSSLCAKRQRIFYPASTKSLLSRTPRDQAPSSYDFELSKHGERISAIKDSMYRGSRKFNDMHSPSYNLTNQAERSAHFEGHPRNLALDMELNAEVDNCTTMVPKKQWSSIFAEVSEYTDQLLLPSASCLNIEAFDVLEEMLEEMQQTRKYERLSSEIQRQKAHSNIDGLHLRRVAEVKLLHHRLVSEKANLQLKRLKLDGLRKRSHLYQSRIEECHKLKFALVKGFLECVGASQEGGRCSTLVTHCSSGENQEEDDKITSMRGELEMLDQSIKCLTKFFETSLKTKRNLKIEDVIKIVNEHLELKHSCWAIRRHLQIWELSDLVTRNGQYEVVLNYQDLVWQRFILNNGAPLSIRISNSLNDLGIKKAYPNINASTAFRFIFGREDDRRIPRSKSLQQETLLTSLLLGTLLDVLEEVETACVELLSLICSTFHSQSSSQLELQLCFLNFKSGQKAAFYIDMVDLCCAAYPADPSELKIRICGMQTSLPASIMDKIMCAIQSLQGGRPMILNLCRRISQIVEASS